MSDDLETAVETRFQRDLREMRERSYRMLAKGPAFISIFFVLGRLSRSLDQPLASIEVFILAVLVMTGLLTSIALLRLHIYGLILLRVWIAALFARQVVQLYLAAPEMHLLLVGSTVLVLAAVIWPYRLIAREYRSLAPS